MKRKFGIEIMKLDPPYIDICIRVGLWAVSIDVPVIFIPRLTVWKYDPQTDDTEPVKTWGGFKW
jgi:hypothetical protein